ncbi:MAG: alpha/beta hydrolase [Myxococcota bacterium]|nr:alpha/beta hydrolase [Myxococcota bacterium]
MRRDGSRALLAALSLLLFAAVPAQGSGNPPNSIEECVDADGNPPPGEDFCIISDKLPFDALDGIPTTREWGIIEGAGYRLEIPENWTGDLVMYAHGFRGATAVDEAAGRVCAAEISVSNPPIRQYLLENGFAWAASSYHRNCYDVKAGVEDTNRLAKAFRRRHGNRNAHTYITGQSMGGHITGAAIELLPNFRCPDGRAGKICRRLARFFGFFTGGVRYDGAVPMCGAMGDVELFDYFLGYVQNARQLTLGASAFPPPPDASTTEFPAIVAGLSGPLFDPVNGVQYPFVRSAAGDNQKGLLENISGGPRPVYEQGFFFWESFFFLLGLAGEGDGTIDGVEDRVVVDNVGVVYQFDQDPAESADESDVNANIGRVAADPLANPDLGPLRLQAVPEIRGKISQPVVSLHTLGDLFVPFSMEQIYAQEVADHGNSDLLVTRATRDFFHCGSNVQEQSEAFADMVSWVETGVRPAGDDVLDPDAVADPAFGCQFTRGERLALGVPACP